jgi:hypothetical protein
MLANLDERIRQVVMRARFSARLLGLAGEEAIAALIDGLAADEFRGPAPFPRHIVCAAELVGQRCPLGDRLAPLRIGHVVQAGAHGLERSEVLISETPVPWESFHRGVMPPAIVNIHPRHAGSAHTAQAFAWWGGVDPAAIARGADLVRAIPPRPRSRYGIARWHTIHRPERT